MNWDFCKTFIAVAETGSYVAAARRLRSSHPTVARQIAALEAGLGTRLFARSNEGLALTAQGTSFKRHADAMAAAALSAEAAAGARGVATRGSVKLSIGPTLAAYWLMPHMRGFLQRHPQIEIDLITHPFPVSVRRREADLVIRITQPGDENLVGSGGSASAFMLRAATPQRTDCRSITANGRATTSSHSPTIVPTPNSAGGAIT